TTEIYTLSLHDALPILGMTPVPRLWSASAAAYMMIADHFEFSPANRTEASGVCSSHCQPGRCTTHQSPVTDLRDREWITRSPSRSEEHTSELQSRGHLV